MSTAKPSMPPMCWRGRSITLGGKRKYRPIWRRQRLGTQDARPYVHVGMIALAQGHKESAHQYLTRALEINPDFSPLYADEAQAALQTLE